MTSQKYNVKHIKYYLDKDRKINNVTSVVLLILQTTVSGRRLMHHAHMALLF